MKRTNSVLAFLLCTFLISVTCLTSLPIVDAQTKAFASQSELSSYGVVNSSQTQVPKSTPTPTPTPTGGGNNIATIPSFWTNPWRSIGDEFYIYWPVTWQGHSTIKISPNPKYSAWAQKWGWMGLNELDGALDNGNRRVSAKPGDRVVFKAWIWVEPSTVGGGGGLYMAIDIYGSEGRICELQGDDGTPCNDPNPPGRLLAPWGSGAWKQYTMDFIVRDTYYGDHDKDVGGGYQGYDRGEAATPDSIMPWFSLLNFESFSEDASAYVYGTELYINP